MAKAFGDVEWLRGVHSVLVTPFTADGKVDDQSLTRLVRGVLAAGADGVTVLGVAGEASKLTAAERSLVIDTVTEAVAGSVPITVGAAGDGTEVVVDQARAACGAGAGAVMVAPPTFVHALPALIAHYGKVAGSVEVPIVLQDYPPASGVMLTPEQLATLVDEVPNIACVKLEGLPTPLRIQQLVKAVHRPVSVMGGLGGVYFLDELRRGSSGTMTGFAYPEALVAIWRAWQAGDGERAAAIYADWLPLLITEGQVGVGLSLRKELLRRRGYIECAAIRSPGVALEPALAEDLTSTLNLLPERAWALVP